MQTSEREMLGTAIPSLTNRERLNFTLYYYEELTTGQLEFFLGETESDTSQTHTAALAHLQIRLSRFTGELL
jgi:DNA-directed RNA polymerase specialized sigma subunit